LKNRASIQGDASTASTSSREAAFELALCCAIGFGVTQSEEESRRYLKQSQKPPKDLELEIMELKHKKVQWQAYQLGIFGKMQARGYTTMLDYTQYYSEKQLGQVKQRYCTEIEGLEKVLGGNHDIVLILNSILGLILRRMRCWSETEEIEMRLVKTASKKLGNEHPYTLACMADLASSHMAQRRWKEAEQLLMRVLEMQMKVLGSENSDTLVSMKNLGITLSNQGRSQEGDELLLQVIEIQRRVFGKDHPATLLSIETLHSKMLNQEALQKSQESSVKVSEMQKILGVMHESTSESMFGLAATYISQKRWEQAEVTLRRVIGMQTTELGDIHFYTLSSIKILGFVVCIQGRHDEGEALVVHVMETLCHTLGPEFRETRDVMALLALRYRNQGRWKDLLELELRFTVSIDIAEGPADTIMQAEDFNSLSNLASGYEHQGRWTEAEKTRFRIIEATKELLGDKHFHTLTNMEILGLTYGLQGRWQEGEGLFVQISGLETEHNEIVKSTEYLSAFKIHQNESRSDLAIIPSTVTKEHHNSLNQSLRHTHGSSHTKRAESERKRFDIWAWNEIESLEKGLRESRPAILESCELAMRPAQIELLAKIREKIEIAPTADNKRGHTITAEPQSELEQEQELEKVEPKLLQRRESHVSFAPELGNVNEVEARAIMCESPEPEYLVSRKDSDSEVTDIPTKLADQDPDRGQNLNVAVPSDIHIEPWEDRVHGAGLVKLLNHKKKRVMKGRRLEAAILMRMTSLEANFTDPGFLSLKESAVEVVG
jgi:tetratricopeptide (TPR) repeat protein